MGCTACEMSAQRGGHFPDGGGSAAVSRVTQALGTPRGARCRVLQRCCCALAGRLQGSVRSPWQPSVGVHFHYFPDCCGALPASPRARPEAASRSVRPAPAPSWASVLQAGPGSSPPWFFAAVGWGRRPAFWPLDGRGQPSWGGRGGAGVSRARPPGLGFPERQQSLGELAVTIDQSAHVLLDMPGRVARKHAPGWDVQVAPFTSEPAKKPQAGCCAAWPSWRARRASRLRGSTASTARQSSAASAARPCSRRAAARRSSALTLDGS